MEQDWGIYQLVEVRGDGGEMMLVGVRVCGISWGGIEAMLEGRQGVHES